MLLTTMVIISLPVSVAAILLLHTMKRVQEQKSQKQLKRIPIHVKTRR